MSGNKDLNIKRIVSICAFVATILIATALLLQCIFNWCGWEASITSKIRDIGEWIAIIVTCISGYFFVARKRKTAWYVVYAIAVTAIVILLILR